MTTYGYIRVSSADQNPERQIVKMHELGITDKYLTVDKASGKNMQRDGFQALLSVLSDGDLLVIDALDRLGRNYDDLTYMWKHIVHDLGCDIMVLEQDIFDSRKFKAMGDAGKLVEDLFVSIFAYGAESERKKIKERQAAGIALAKSKGLYTGRKAVSVDPDKLQAMKDATASGDITVTAAAKELGISRSTWYKLTA